jgi:LysR family glycine cleavage system transcriptional activator
MNRRLPPLVAMRVFECSARYMSFTRAADALGVTPPAVSHQIKALEDWLGTPLFKRLNRSIKLTKAGELYAPLLTSAFDILVEATNKVVNMGGARILKVAALDSFSAVWLLPRLHHFRERHPDLDVRFTTLGQDSDPLSSGSVDLEIRYGVGSWPSLHVREIMREDIFPVCSPKLLDGRHQLKTLSDLKHFDLLHDVATLDWKSFLTHFGVTDVDPERGYGFTQSHFVLQACIDGNGVALGREAIVAEALAKGQLVRPLKESVPSEYSYYIVTREEESDLPHIKSFAAWLIEETRSFMEEHKIRHNREHA